MRKKLIRIQAKKRARKRASALANSILATPAFEKAADELLKRRAKAYRKMAE